MRILYSIIIGFILISVSMIATAALNAWSAEEPISMIFSPMLEAMTDERLATDAELIVIATVGEEAPHRWNTSDGTRPPGIKANELPNDLMIVKDRRVVVESTLKGTPSDGEVWVRTPGGVVGRDRIDFDSQAEFVAGQRVVLFLTREDWYGAHIGPEHFTVVCDRQGLFSIDDDRAVRGDHELPLADLLAIIARDT